MKYRIIGVGTMWFVVACWFVGLSCFLWPLWLASYAMILPLGWAVLTARLEGNDSWEQVGRVLVRPLRVERLPRARALRRPNDRGAKRARSR